MVATLVIIISWDVENITIKRARSLIETKDPLLAG
jgi:hypothetical protein